MVDNDSTKAQEFNYEGETFSSPIKITKAFSSCSIEILLGEKQKVCNVRKTWN